jgi:large subunit ribosomal protein L35
MAKSAKRVARIKKLRANRQVAVKIKTKRAAAKRYKVLGSGKVKVPHCNKQHLTGDKTRKRKNKLRKGKIMRAESMLLVKRCLPNSF